MQALEARIKTLEAQNRDALATYDTKTTAYDRLAKELSEQHQKYVDQRKEFSALEEKAQTLENAANNFKFRETNLQQEMELLRKNTEWYEGELKTRTADSTRFRKEKNAQVADLQRANADHAETIDALQRTEALLRKHAEELRAKADEDRLHIQQLEDDAATNEANFRSELDNAKRLAAIQLKTAELAKNRLEELTRDYHTLQEGAAEEVGQLQADIELERTKAAEAESRAASLESTVENLEREAVQLKTGTPRRVANGSSYGTPGRAGSPAVGGMTNTKIFAENSALKEQLRDARNENEQKATVMQNMIDELEQLEPAVEELRRTNESLTTQISEISSDLEDAVAEKDAAKKEERKARGDLEGARRETTQLQKQVQDLTVQLRSLIWRQQAAEQGLASLTAEQQQFVIASENNQLPEGQSYGETATDQIISQHLILYKDIASLQAQNAELDRTIRDVAAKHEGEEANLKKAQHEKDLVELGQLRTRLAEYEDQIKSLNTRAHSYKKERDMYRQVATSRGLVSQDSEGPSAFGQSFNSQAPMTPMRGLGASQFNDQTPQANHIPGVDKLVKDLQNQMDILKEESATDRATLKSQVEGLTKDNGQLQSEKLRLDSQVRREQERYNRLESTIKMMESEKDTLQERYHNVQASLAKQDSKVIKAEQEAVDALSRVEGLEHELTNLKASQSMWKTIEERLTERNQELVDERDRLSQLVTQVHNLRNDQELANAENRRRLQDRVDSLESELQSAQRKLDDEVSEHKKATLQRDYERTEAQRRIDDLVKAKNDADVRCASAEAGRQQLQQRVNELQSQLQTAEERVQALRPIPTPRTNGSARDEAASREEELIAQVSNLERKLERKQEDLDAAKAQIEGFQNIAQEAEEALNKAIETRDDLQAELTTVQEEKDTVIADLQRRVDAISAEFTTTNGELVELRGQHEQDTMRLTQEKESLEAEIANLKTDVEDYKAEAERQTEYVKSQADIATRARQDYEHELAKHGETMSTLRTLRDEYNSIKSEIAQFKAQAEAARTALEQNEEHWKSTQSQYESQIADVKRTYDDLKQHNKTLLQQFDNYKTQINDLKASRATVATGDANADGPGSSKLDEINTFLKSEKDALEIQLAMRDQEAKRLDSKLTHTQNQLDQMREKLHVEQARKQTSSTGTDITKLQKQIEDYNLIRESNTTLRNDTARLEAKLAEKAQEMENLHNEIGPLKTRIEELEGELELAQGYYEQEQKQRVAIEERYNKFLHRSEQIDPRELEALKKSIEDVQTERDQLAEQAAGLNEQVINLTQESTALKEQMVNVKQQDGKTHEAATEEAVKAAKKEQQTKFQKIHQERINAKVEIINTITKERDDAQTQLTTMQQELEAARQELSSAQTLSTQSQEQATALQQEKEQLQAQLATLQQAVETANAARDEAVSKITASGNADADVSTGEEGQVHETENSGSDQQVANLQKLLDDTKKQLAEVQNRAFSAENDYASLKIKESFARDQVAKLEKDDVSTVYRPSSQLLTHAQADKGNRIVELQEQLTAAQNQAPQATSEVPVAQPSNDPALQAEIEKLKQELSEAHKALAESQAAANAAVSTENVADETAKPDSQESDERSTALLADIEQREAKLKELEESLAQREGVVAKREASSEGLKNKLNEMLKKKTTEHQSEVTRIKAEHQAELERAQEAAQASQIQASSTSTASSASMSVNEEATDGSMYAVDTEEFPYESTSLEEVKKFIATHKIASKLFQHNVTKHVKSATKESNAAIESLKAENATLKTENEALKIKEPSTPAIKSEAKPEQKTNESLEAALAEAQKERDMIAQKMKAKESLVGAVRAKWGSIQKIAQDTPTREVGDAVQEANKAKAPVPTPAQQPGHAQPAARAPTPTTSVAGQPPAAPVSNQPQAQQSTPATSAIAQPNGMNAPVATQASRPAHAQQPNPFIPTNPANAFGQAPYPFGAPQAQGGIQNPFMQGQQGGRGITPNAFGQGPRPAQQPPQHQHGGRGRGDGMGTGPGALQNLMGAQGTTGIPRPGSNIPMPGGRGRGQQQQPQPGQLPAINTQQPSQIGRGGNRGGRGAGRGANQGSPRTSLNAGAAQFQPGVQAPQGAGRGQKRGAEDEGDGARGGKRARGRGQGSGGSGSGSGNAGGE